MPPTTTMSSAMLDQLREKLLATMEKKKVDEVIENFWAGRRRTTSLGAPGQLDQRIQSRIAESIRVERAQIDAQSPARIAAHLRACWRRTTLAGARRQALNTICTSIKSQRHINKAGRRQRVLTVMDDEVTQQFDAAIESEVTFAPGITIDSFKETVQSAVN